jgi:hypothetical protein
VFGYVCVYKRERDEKSEREEKKKAREQTCGLGQWSQKRTDVFRTTETPTIGRKRRLSAAERGWREKERERKQPMT